MSLPADIARQLQQLFREQAHAMRQIAHDAVTQAFGGRMNGGKLDGDAVLAATSTGLGVMQPDNTTIEVDDQGVISSLSGMPIIAQAVVSGSPAASVTISPIRQDFEDIVFAIDGRVTGVSNGYDWITWQANSDTGANYDAQDLLVVNTAGYASPITAATYGYCGVLADSAMDSGVAGRVEGVILDYSGTTWDKALACMYGSVGGSVTADFLTGSGQSNWRNTAPVQALTFAPENGSFAVGTVITLYGRGHGAVPVWSPVGAFDGSDDYVALGSTSTIAPSAITIMAFVKTPDTTRQQQMIVSKGAVSGAGPLDLRFNDNSTEAVMFQVRTSGGYTGVYGGTNLADDTWYHVAGTFNGTSDKIYVDGVLDGTTSFASTSITYTSTGDYSIGRRNSDGYYFKGDIYDVRIYNTALTQLQIAQIASGGADPASGNLVGRWQFTEGVGGSVADSSGAGNAGTWHGTGNHWSTK